MFCSKLILREHRNAVVFVKPIECFVFAVISPHYHNTKPLILTLQNYFNFLKYRVCTNVRYTLQHKQLICTVAVYRQ
jgi:hypothetical protein